VCGGLGVALGFVGVLAEAAAHYGQSASAAKGEELAKALYKLAWSHYHADKLNEAAAAFDQLIDRCPDSEFTAEAHYLAGLILQKQDKHRDAIARFRKALAAKPSAEYRERSLVQIGQSQQALGKWADALKTYQTAIEEFPQGKLHLDATYGVGLASQHLGAYKDAEEAFAKVIAATKTELAARAQYGLGEIEFLQGNYKEAIAKLLAVEITYAYDTWRAASMLKVMECHLKLGNAERARYYRDELARKFPKSDCVPKADKLLAQAAKGEKPDVPKKKGAPGAEEPEP